MIGPKTWDRTCGNFWDFSRMAVTARIFVDCLGLCVGNFAIKCMLDVNKCREWVVDRSQNMGPNYGNIFGHLGCP